MSADQYLTSTQPQSHVEQYSKNNLETVKLSYTEFNLLGKSTIIIIHGAFVSSKDWNLVTPYISTSYHLLLPDLPSHGESHAIKPFSIEYSSLLIFQLIIKHARNGKAHIIGHSLGARIAIDLVSKHPDLINDVIVSGYEVCPPNATSPAAPYFMWVTQRFERLVPRSVISWLMSSTPLSRSDVKIPTMDFCHQSVTAMSSVEWPSPWPARSIIIAAGKSGIIPSNDHPHDALKLMEIGMVVNEDTVVYTHPEMRHPWNRQDPKLFAEFVEAWIERRDLPSGFIRF